MTLDDHSIVVFAVIAGLFSIVLCDVKINVVANRATAIEQERESYASKMAAYMNKNADPCDDFYEYSCGNYFKVHKFKHGFGKTNVVNLVTDERNDALHNIFTEPVNSANITVKEKAKLFYQSCMRVNIFDYPKSETYLKLINSLGGWPALDRYWSRRQFNWFKVVTKLASYGSNAFLAVRSDEEFLKIEVDFLGFHQFMSDRPFTRKYNMNRGIIVKILEMYGVATKISRKIFKEMLQLGKDYLKFLKSCFNIRDDNEITLTIDELKNKIPEIDWDEYTRSLFGEEVDSSMKVTVAQMKCIKKLPTFFTPKNARSVATYMFLRLLFDLHNEFYYPKYKKDFCIRKMNDLMADVMTAMYIYSDYHQQIVEDEVTVLASYIKSAFKGIIQESEWMDKQTKRKALLKLNNMKMVIGDVELSLDLETMENDYKNFHIGVDSNFYESNLALVEMNTRKKYHAYLEDEDQPEIYISDVNAYYNPVQNRIVLPAGILRKPFFNRDLPKSYNFGAIGANIIGHEMTHGFDSNGRRYNADGSEENWWTPQSDAAFEERANCFVETYNTYKILETNTNVKGYITLPENIADSGGLRQGYFAYKKWLKENAGYFDMEKEVLPKLNLTNTQLFFLAYAQSHCGRYKRAGYRSEHTVNKFRVIGSISNFDEFGKEFSCELGTTMNPKKKCVLW